MINLFNIKYFLFSLLFSGFTSYVHAQSYEWVKGMGNSSNNDQGKSLALDAHSNVYTTGYFNGTVDFDPGFATSNLTSNGSTDIYVSKLDSTGNYRWAYSFGASSGDQGRSITTDNMGNVYVYGTFNGTVDFDPGLGTSNLAATSTSIFILKLDTSGNFVWAKAFGAGTTITNEGNRTIAVDLTGNIYVTGQFTGTVDFDPGSNTANLTSNGNSDAFVAKLDGNGNYVWAKQFGSTAADKGNSIALDASGTPYIIGDFRNTVDFDPGLGVANLTYTGSGERTFVLKLDTNGNYVWAKGITDFTGTYDYLYAHCLAIGDGIYITGEYYGTIDFDPGLGVQNLIAAPNNQSYILKLDLNGNYVWAKGVDGSVGGVRGLSICIGPNESVYSTGTYGGTTDFSPGQGVANLISSLDGNIYIMKFDFGGNFIWVKGVGGDHGGARSIEVASELSIYTTGDFAGISKSADFDPGPDTAILYSNPYTDIFVLKLGQPPCNSFTTITASACGSYTFNGITYDSTGIYEQTYTNANNCDSFVTLHLTINSSLDTVSVTTCDSFLFNGFYYTTSGIYTDSFTNIHNCDSVLTLNLTIAGTSSLTILNVDTCESYSLNWQTYTQTGVYYDTFMAASGCDSIIQLNLTINYSSDTVLTITACDYYAVAGNTYNTSGNYSLVIPTLSGCDSTILLNLTINNSPTANITQSGNQLSASAGGTYQWLDCNNSFSIIPAATQQMFTPSIDGLYAVVVTLNGCSDTSTCVAIGNGGTSIPTLGKGNAISVYPNPTNGLITLKAQNSVSNATIKLMNVAGKILEARDNQYGQFLIVDLGSYASGVYIVELENQGEKLRVKLVRE